MSHMPIQFDCQMYVTRRGAISFNLPLEAGPQKVARLEPIEYDALVDPRFRRLLAAFESVPKPLLAGV